MSTTNNIQQIRIADHAQWMRERSQDVTASVAGCLLGIHPYWTAYGLHLFKCESVTEDPEETVMMRQGRLLEPVAVQLMREMRRDWEIIYPVGIYYRDSAARLGATPDVLVRDERGRWGVIQIKTVERWVFKRKWHDEDGELEPPLWIATQAIIEAYLTKVEWAAVAVLIVGSGLELKLVDVPLHLALIDRIKSEVAAFWRGVETGKLPDPDHVRDAKLLEQMFEYRDEIVDLTGDNSLVALVDERAKLSKTKRNAEARLKDIKGEILLKLHGASFGRIADGRCITVKLIEKNGYTVEPFSYPDIRVKEIRP